MGNTDPTKKPGVNSSARFLKRLNNSFHTLFNLIDRYEVSISQMTMNLLLFTLMFSFVYHC
jgi:hypothetical protein